MTKADTSVKWFHSGMADAPVLSGAADALITLLDACLIAGFSTRTPDSVVVSGGVATVNISAGNPYEQHAVIHISGASNAVLNAEWRIDSATASSFTFLCPGVADGAVTGASVKRPPAGWVKTFTGVNTAVYRSALVESTQLFLKVTDPVGANATVRGYGFVDAAGAGTDEFPTTAQKALSLWAKSNGSTSQRREWVVVADGRFIHYACMSDPLSTFYESQYVLGKFGDVNPRVTNDRYHALITAAASTSGARTDNTTTDMSSSPGSSARFFARAENQSTVSVPTTFATAYSAAGIFGNSPDGRFTLCGLAAQSRGFMPGFYLCGEVIAGLPPVFVEYFEGAAFLFIQVVTVASSNVKGRYCAIKITGPW